MPFLYILNGADVGRSFEVAPGALLGRSNECAVPLRSTSVSRQHARLEQHGDAWRLVDLGSRNGIARPDGGAREHELALADGDEVQVGDVLLRFRTQRVAATPALVVPTPRASELARARAADAPPTRAAQAQHQVDEIELESRDSRPSATVPAERAAPAAALAAHASTPRKIQLAAHEEVAPDARTEFVRRMQRESEGRWWHADLEQLPGWVKAACALLAVCVCAALVYGAYRVMLSLRG